MKEYDTFFFKNIFFLIFSCLSLNFKRLMIVRRVMNNFFINQHLLHARKPAFIAADRVADVIAANQWQSICS